MFFVIGPSPRNQYIHIEKIPHGKSDKNLRTVSVVNAGCCGAGAKILAPVWRQRVVDTGMVEPEVFCALRRRNPDTLNFCVRTKARMRKASTSDTLKLRVSLGWAWYYGITRMGERQ